MRVILPYSSANWWHAALNSTREIFREKSILVPIGASRLELLLYYPVTPEPEGAVHTESHHHE